MTRTNHKPETSTERARRDAATQPLDPPPRAARLGAASGVEGPGRAQRLQRREHDRPLYDADSKEQPFESTGARRYPSATPLVGLRSGSGFADLRSLPAPRLFAFVESSL